MNKLIKLLVFFVLWNFLSTTAYAANTGSGKELFERHCVQCHQPGQEMMMPMTYSLRDSLMQPDSVLREKILSGTNAMPGYYGLLNNKEISDILLYMRMIW